MLLAGENDVTFKSGNSLYLHSWDADRTFLLKEPKRLQDLWGILDTVGRYSAGNVHTKEIRDPKDAHRVTEEFIVKPYRGIQARPMKVWPCFNKCQSMDEDQQRLIVKFPAQLYGLPRPRVLLSDEHNSTLLMACGRNYILWNVLTTDILRLNGLEDDDNIWRYANKACKERRASTESFFDAALQYRDSTLTRILPICSRAILHDIKGHHDVILEYFVPFGWLDHHAKDEKLLSIFSPQKYGLSTARAIFIHEDDKNYFIDGNSEEFYLWNRLGKFLDHTEEPLGLWNVLRELPYPLAFFQRYSVSALP